MKQFVFIVLALTASPLSSDHWPQWRGPDGMGISKETNVPVKWSATENVLWSSKNNGWGASTPVVWGDRLFMTSQIGSGPVHYGYKPGEINQNEGQEVVFLVQCLSVRDGSPVWEKRIPAEGELHAVHSMHNLASLSCVTDGKHVVAWFATGQIVCYDMSGALIWKRHLGKEISPFEIKWAHGSSPYLHDGKLYLLCDHTPAAYLLAVDITTGKTIWKADRGTEGRTYTTPIVVDAGARKELIINAQNTIDAYDPATGKLLWRADEYCKVPVPVPVASGGILYINRGYRSGPYMAIRTGGSGDVSKTHTVWRKPTGAPYVSCMLLLDDLLYLSSETGIVRCVNAKDGETVWQERLDGKFWASPVSAAGRIYLLADSGDMFVLKAGRKFEVLARNSLGETTITSPSISNGLMFIRSDKHLFCIGTQ